MPRASTDLRAPRDDAVRTLAARVVAGLLAVTAPALAASDDARSNVYGDPFVQATSGLASCPVPEGPMLTAQEARAEAHWRVERGTSCHRSGRCRLPNSYRYDGELVPRVKQFIERTGRFANTSVWIVGQRRWIYLQGCVHDARQSADLLQAVRGIDDVEAVVDQLGIGAGAKPAYRVVAH